jgi:hypothetical protein
MRNFMEVYAKKVTSVINGWDRIRFRGTIRWLVCTKGIVVRKDAAFFMRGGAAFAGLWARRRAA